MLTVYIYNTFHIIIMMMLIVIGYRCITYAPIKIKFLSIIGLFLLFLREIALLILLLSKSLIYLYLLKLFVYLNLPIILILSIISLYIFLRNDKIQFVCCIWMAIFLFLGFCLFMYKANSTMILSIYGYGFVIENIIVLLGIYVIFNTLFLLASILVLGKRNVNNFGISLVITASIVSIIEILAPLVGIAVMPNCIIGELIWLMVFYYGIDRLK